ncbi:MAG TPA: hypothetical protein VNI01_08135 [Elusimicrobiota bacterium]|jgi:hypothetical protein|nr:hypothetical protein [Elusimicrobiota bacterium]
MAMLPAAFSVLLVWAAPARAAGPAHATDEAGIREWEERTPPENKKAIEDLNKRVREREAARQQKGLQPGQSPPDDVPEQAPDGRPIARAAEGPANLSDLMQAAEEEKLRAPRDAVNHMATVKAPGVLALTEAFFYQVYCNGNPSDGDTAAELAAIRQGLSKPRGWGSFPTVQIGLLPSDDHPSNKGVLGTWSGGEIRLRAGAGETIQVLSHEVRHHNDGVWAGPIDGNGWPARPELPPERGSPPENYAYEQMTKELGGPSYVHCQPRPLVSPARSGA